MPKKKKVEVIMAGTAVEPVEVNPEKTSVELVGLKSEVSPVAPADPIISVVALGSFHDGAFKHDFAKLGYDVHWKDREVRDIPAQLYAKLMRRSGGKFALKGTR